MRALIICIMLFGISCCANDQPKPSNKVVESTWISGRLDYVKDNTTNLCFAAYLFGFKSESGTLANVPGAIANVPCTLEVLSQIKDGGK